MIIKALTISIFVFLINIVYAQSSCGRERCCQLTTCTTQYCLLATSETWISSEQFSGSTKLILVNNECLPCPYNCQTCTSQTSCTQCGANYYMNNNVCLSCSYQCKTCQLINSLIRCSECQNGFYLDTTIAQCISCPTGATTCTSTVILTCAISYFKQSNSLFCSKCSLNCLNCIAATTCTQCNNGYYLSNNNCNACTKTNCLSCTVFGGGSLQLCNNCVAGYTASSGNCVACGSNCKLCNTNNCFSCNAGYALTNGNCTLPNTQVTKCIQYTSSLTCKTCILGYYVNNNKCQPCSLMCSACYGRHFGACTVCQSYSKLYNQMCILNNFPDTNTIISYYSIPYEINSFTGGALGCVNTLYEGTQLSITITNLQSYEITIKWKVYGKDAIIGYNVSMNNNSGVFTTSSQFYVYCSTNYYLSIENFTFSSIKLSNTLVFTALNGTISFSEMIITAKKCNSLCTECTSVGCTKCLTSNLYSQEAFCVFSCSIGYYIDSVNKNCLKQCPLGTYPRNTDVTCQQCISPCSNCITQIKCISCVTGYFLFTNGSCLLACPYTYFGRNQTLTCERCLGRCLTCISQVQCIICKQGFLASNKSCIDDCTTIQGYYSQVTTLDCKVCHSSCLTCNLIATRCTSCSNTKVFYNYQCLDTCPIKYYPNNKICLACIYPCQTCSNSSSTCLSCIDRYLLNNQCQIFCPSGYYEDNINLLCAVCNINCIKCLYASDNCLQCKTGFYYYNFKCFPLCPNQFYGNITTKNCQNCVNLCYNCINTTYCSSCKSNFLQNGDCIRAGLCQPTKYADITILQCAACQSPCFRCQYASTVCIQCYSNSTQPYLEGQKCVSNCSSQFFYAVNGKCNLCEQPCKTCLNQTACLSCIIGYKYSNNVCSSTCSIGTYFNAAITDCKICSTNCIACVSDTFCQICANNFFIYSTDSTTATCESNCTSTFYSDVSSKSCQKCLFPCIDCLSTIDCLSCQTGVLYQNRCIGTCPDSTFLSNGQCLNCGGNCLTCFDNAAKCKVCKTNFFLKGTQCLNPCLNGFYGQIFSQQCLTCPLACSQCTNLTFCTACIENKTFLVQSTNLCVSSCPTGYYGNFTTQLCTLCNSKCLTCKLDSSNCLSCATGYKLVRLNSLQFDCQITCPQLYYAEGTICYPCNFPCLNCTSSITCLSCTVGMFLHPLSGSCLHNCPLQTFLSNNICQDCISPCATCSNETSCLSCQNNLTVYNGGCIATCPDTYYRSDSGLCAQCYGFCRTCTSKFYCLSCNAGYGYEGFCYSSCPSGSYADLANGICILCQSPCLQCVSSAKYCRRCENNQFAYKGNCSSQCPQFTYASNFKCSPCSFPCLTCQNQYLCSSCVGGYLLYLKKSCIVNTPRCPNDYYKKDSIQCVPITDCPNNYFIDDQLRTCSQNCEIGKYTDITNKKCLTSCPQGYYVGQNLICILYSQNVPSLLGMKSIAFIQSSRMQVAILYNQTVVWQDLSNKLYTLQSLTSRLLQTSQISASNTTVSYQQTNTNNLELALQQLPYKLNINIPAHKLSSSSTKLPLQNPNFQIRLPNFEVYTYGEIYSATIIKQISQGISYIILLISILFLFINRLSDLYIIWDTVQLLYILLFLEIQYPPVLNEFLRGMSFTHLYFVPSLFTQSNVRTVSSLPFYAYSYDNNFLRTAGHSVLILLIALIIYIILKIMQLLIKKVTCIGLFMKQYPKIKNFIYRGILRFRWHHASDVFFITYLNIMLFGISQIYYISQNNNRSVSNAICIIFTILYIIFPIFVGYKLYKHYGNISRGKFVHNLKCFYRGIEKDNKFGISMILLRYVRKLFYALLIAIFSDTPMYALPMLMFTSVLFSIFIIANKPFKKKLSNIITLISEISLVLVLALIAIVVFLSNSLDSSTKQVIGWICCGILIIVIFVLIYQVFVKTLFYLEPQYEKKPTALYDPLKDQAYLRSKAQQFFDRIFPQLRNNFFNDDDQQEQLFDHEEGDSQDSQNNELREKDWRLEASQNQSDQFNHHNSEQNSSKTLTQNAKKKIPKYLIRCVKQIS